MSNDGREIREVWFDSGEAACKISSDDKHGLRMVCEYHGTYDEDWIVMYRKADGVEVERHNPRFVSSIYWSQT